MYKIALLLTINIFLFSNSYSSETSTFLKNKTDSEIMAYVTSLSGTLKYKIVDDYSSIKPEHTDLAVRVIGKNELTIILYSDKLHKNGRFSITERDELYSHIHYLTSLNYKTREYFLNN